MEVKLTDSQDSIVLVETSEREELEVDLGQVQRQWKQIVATSEKNLGTLSVYRLVTRSASIGERENGDDV